MIILGFILLFFIMASFFIERRAIINQLDIDVLLVDEEDTNFYLYLLDNDNNLHAVEVFIDLNLHTAIPEIFKLYTKKSNSLPIGFYSPIVLSTEIFEYKSNDDVLIIKVSDDFFRSITNELKTSLSWTFKQLGYQKIIIQTNTKTLEINCDENVVLNNSLLNNNRQNIITIFYRQKDAFFPKSYQCMLENELDYIYYQLCDYFNIDKENVDYHYDLTEERIIIYFEDYNNQINDLIIDSFKTTIFLNNLAFDVVIVKNKEVFS